MNNPLLAIIASSFLLSCADSSSHITPNKVTQDYHKTETENRKYTCDRGTKLSVNFTSTQNNSDKNVAIVNGFGKQAIVLAYKPVASGFLYSNGKYTLRGKGNKATWTVGRMADSHCTLGDKFISHKNTK